jgi:predicted nucleic acid-binding Zn ribbon protein
MDRSRTKRIDEVIREYLDKLPAGEKMKEIAVISSWEKVVGTALARHTQKIYIRDKVLYVHLDSSVVRNELFMQREVLLARLTEEAGQEVITKIILK